MSVFILLSPTAIIPILTAVGVITHALITFFPILAANPADVGAQIGVLKSISIIGGLVYLIGSSCSKSASCKAKVE